MRTSARRQAIKVDPELQRQLDQRAAGAGPVEAVFTLRQEKTTKRAASPGHIEAAVRRLLRRVEAQVGEAPQDFNVFRNLGAFVVVAPARFVSVLAAQVEIATATANRQPRSMIIPPRGKRPSTSPS
ncbi:MAG: hypothetical protein A2Z07_11165 [Armatimonadetes bacterium RBG_16_67_12]|nr:MAG: hypothetical protein A2Z07_11165 [Armatimonadetes bacterium RBG_16_67_12]